MRIGLVSYEYPPQSGLGGVGTYVYRLAGALGRAGYEVVVLAGPTDQPTELPQPNVTLHRIAAQYHPPLGLRSLRFLYWRVFSAFMDRAHAIVWHWLRWDIASSQALLDIHAKTPLDVIEAPEHAANGLAVARLQKWPSVIRVHGPWDLFFGINRTEGTALNRLLASLERRSTRYAQVVTAPSHTMAAFIQNRWGLEVRPSNVPNFMDVPQEPAPLPDEDEAQRIVCAGRLERFKGQDVLVRAFARVAARHPRAELVLIGPDQWSTVRSFSAVVDEMVPDPDIRQRIHLRGTQTLEEVQAALRSATVGAICSSGFESFSFSTLEAMAAARPIIASRSGAIPELLDQGRCGMLAAPGDVQHFADSLDQLLSDRSLCLKLSLAAHARARTVYDTQAVLPAFIATYEEARRRFQLRTGRPLPDATPHVPPL